VPARRAKSQESRPKVVYKAPSDLTAGVETGKAVDAEELTRQAFLSGLDRVAVAASLRMGILEAWGKYQLGEWALPELLLASRAFVRALDVWAGHHESGDPSIATAIVGCVHGDTHDHGKNIVASIWRSHDVRVLDLGTSVLPETFGEYVRLHKPEIVGISATMTTTPPIVERTITEIRSSSRAVRIAVGGKAITEALTTKWGVDGYAEHCGQVSDLLQHLLRNKKRVIS
jgi:5-methyltetrahydrofolate--homocysteine methyltransferase